MTTVHSRLGASSAKRWSACPGSNQFIATVPEYLQDTSSDFADEGTLAHQEGERCLLSGEDSKDENVQVYVDAIREIMAGSMHELFVEERVKINDEMFGTSDAVLSDFLEGELIICDLKFGAGVAVEVEENPQLLYYLLGAWKKLGDHFSTFKVMVVQPRCHHDSGPVRTWVVSEARLREFETEILAAAERTKAPDAPLVAGKHCHFCPAVAVCPKLKESIHNGMANPILGEALKAAENLGFYKAALERVVYKSLNDGRAVEGFKLVQGRSSRKWKDPHGLKELLKDEPTAWTEPEIKSVAQLEKLKAFKEIAKEHSFKAPGGLTLARAEDKRPAFSRALSDFDDVSIDEDS